MLWKFKGFYIGVFVFVCGLYIVYDVLPRFSAAIAAGDSRGWYVDPEDLPPPANPLSDKYIVYRCQYKCRGLADREKGVVTSYVVSQMPRRKFGIMMSKRCDFSRYVIPNLVNWVVSKNMFQGKSVGSKRNVDNWSLGKAMQVSNLESMFNKEVMYYQGNMDFVNVLMNKTSFRSLPWTKNKTHHELYRIALGHLFKLAPNTARKYTEFRKKTSNRKLVCTHLRMGKSGTIPYDSPKPEKPNMDAVISFLRQTISKSSKVFVATDSCKARRRMMKAFPSKYVEIPGPIVHIDHPANLPCTGLEKAVLDQFVLSKCDILVMSNSGFSRIAFLLRGTDNQLYLAQYKNVSRAKQMNPTQ